MINIKDYGAGSIKFKSKQRSVKQIAKSSLSPKWQCEIIQNIFKKYPLKNAIELGTNLGLTALYMGLAKGDSTIYTIEADPILSKIAINNFDSLNCKNINLINDTFENALPQLVQRIENIDFLFLDGNHRFSPTIEYYNFLKERLNENSIVMVDDIYWSTEMKKAWQELKKDRQVSMSLDMYYFGFLFFNKNVKQKIDLTYIPFKYKPYKLGLFG